MRVRVLLFQLVVNAVRIKNIWQECFSYFSRVSSLSNLGKGWGGVKAFKLKKKNSVPTV
jgi:hypothetical protein